MGYPAGRWVPGRLILGGPSPGGAEVTSAAPEHDGLGLLLSILEIQPSKTWPGNPTVIKLVTLLKKYRCLKLFQNLRYKQFRNKTIPTIVFEQTISVCYLFISVRFVKHI